MKYVLYGEMAKLAKEEDEFVRTSLEAAGVPFSVGKKLPKGLHVLRTCRIIDLSREHFDKMARRLPDGRNIPLETLTACVLGPAGDDERMVCMVDGVKRAQYSSERQAAFRHTFDVTMHKESVKYNAGLERPLATLMFSLGSSHSTLVIAEKYAGAVCSKRLTKILLRDQRRKEHMMSCVFAMNSCKVGGKTWAADFWDNFVRKLPIRKNFGGNVGSYMQSHMCHMCTVQLECPDGAPEALFLGDEKLSCWRCRGEEQPVEGQPDFVSADRGGGLCRVCILQPIDPIDPVGLEKVKGYLRDSGLLVADESTPPKFCVLSPLFLSLLFGGNFGEEVKALGLAARGAQSIFTDAKAFEQIYEYYSQAWRDDSTYPLGVVESTKYMEKARTFGCSRKNTNTSPGLFGHLHLVKTHPLLGPFLDKHLVPLSSDIKPYKHVERKTYAANIKLEQLWRVVPRGVRTTGIFDSGLHVTHMFTDHLFQVFDGLVRVAFERLTARGTGKYMGHKSKLPQKLTLMSVMFQTIVGCPDILSDLHLILLNHPNDPAAQCYIALLEWHIPLAMTYVLIFQLGRSDDVERRRWAFDVWRRKLMPLMVLTIHFLGSVEYGKVMLQFETKLEWLEKHAPEYFMLLRDNFGKVMDAQPIELIHSWISNNFTRINLSQIDSDQTDTVFQLKDFLQRIKVDLYRECGISLAGAAHGTQSTERLAGDVAVMTEHLREVVRDVGKEALLFQRTPRTLRPAGGVEAVMSPSVGPITPKMRLMTKDVFEYYDEIARKLTQEFRQDLSSEELNAMCASANIDVKGGVEDAADHSREKRDRDTAFAEGDTPEIRRRATEERVARRARLSVRSCDRARELVFGPGADPDMHSVTDIVEALVLLFPGGGHAFADLKKVGFGDERPPLPACVGEGCKNMRRVSAVMKRVMGGAEAGGEVERATEVVEFTAGASWGPSLTNYHAAARAAGLEGLEPDFLLCGDVRVTAHGPDTMTAALLELHRVISDAIAKALIECLVSIAGGAPRDAMEIAKRLADLRHGDACDVLVQASNQALFVVVFCAAQTVNALFEWLECRDGMEADDVEAMGRGFPAWVHVDLVEARDDLNEQIASKRPNGALAFSPDGQPGIDLRTGVYKLRDFIVGLCDRGICHLPEPRESERSDDFE